MSFPSDYERICSVSQFTERLKEEFGRPIIDYECFIGIQSIPSW